MEPAEIADRLGLGPMRRPAVVLKDAEPYPVRRLDTDSGPWVVKVNVLRPEHEFWKGAVAQAGALETAAWSAGVPVPEPFIAPDEGLGVWHHLGGDHYARAARFLEGTEPVVPVAPDLATWAGSVTAAFERLAIPADPGIDADYTLHPESDWDDWLAQAQELDVLDARQARELKSTALRVNAIVGDALAADPVKLVMHRDTSSDNIRLTADGPVLLDFDAAGPQVPWWELVCIAFYAASADLGAAAPERATVDACLDGYTAAGGRGGATDETAFTGLLAMRLSFAAYQTWMACGHRGGSPELRAEFARGLRESITALSAQLEAIPAWAAWLRG